jgi:hypothetical protein
MTNTFVPPLDYASSYTRWVHADEDPTSDITIHENLYYTLEWSSAGQWIKAIPTAQLNGNVVFLQFSLQNISGNFNKSGSATASTGVDIWLTDTTTAPPSPSFRFLADIENTFLGSLRIETGMGVSVSTFYSFSYLSSASAGIDTLSFNYLNLFPPSS